MQIPLSQWRRTRRNRKLGNTHKTTGNSVDGVVRPPSMTGNESLNKTPPPYRQMLLKTDREISRPRCQPCGVSLEAGRFYLPDS